MQSYFVQLYTKHGTTRARPAALQVVFGFVLKFQLRCYVLLADEIHRRRRDDARILQALQHSIEELGLVVVAPSTPRAKTLEHGHGGFIVLSVPLNNCAFCVLNGFFGITLPQAVELVKKFRTLHFQHHRMRRVKYQRGATSTALTAQPST